MMKPTMPILIAAAAVAAAAAYVAIRGAKNTGFAIGTGAADLVGGVLSGAVVGTGQAFGIPQTDADQCTADLAAGRTWDASFSCPALRWAKSLVGGR